jgi:hypothetical protein
VPIGTEPIKNDPPCFQNEQSFGRFARLKKDRAQIRAMPTTVFVTPKGTIVDTVNGMLVESQMRAKIERLIASS